MSQSEAFQVLQGQCFLWEYGALFATDTRMENASTCHHHLNMKIDDVLWVLCCLSQGEKYLVLKKKYRQILHERDARPPGMDGDGRTPFSPTRSPAAALREAPDSLTSSPQQKEQREEPGGAAEVKFKPSEPEQNQLKSG